MSTCDETKHQTRKTCISLKDAEGKKNCVWDKKKGVPGLCRSKKRRSRKKPAKKKSCTSYRKTKDPKCGGQPDCEWVVRKGCQKKKSPAKKLKKNMPKEKKTMIKTPKNWIKEYIAADPADPNSQYQKMLHKFGRSEARGDKWEDKKQNTDIPMARLETLLEDTEDIDYRHWVESLEPVTIADLQRMIKSGTAYPVYYTQGYPRWLGASSEVIQQGWFYPGDLGEIAENGGGAYYFLDTAAIERLVKDDKDTITLENTSGKSSKFWEISWKALPNGEFEYTTRWGKIATEGALSVHKGRNEKTKQGTKKSIEKLIESKRKKGYV